MAIFERYINTLLAHEGGLADHPNDPGGLTNKGITIGTFKRHAKPILGIEPTEGNLRRLTDEQASRIYRVAFWDTMRAGDIHDQAVANIVFDMYVNATSIALPLLQFVLNRSFGKKLAVDGVVGPKTLAAVNSVDLDSLHDRYKDARIKYYNYRTANLPQSDPFYKFIRSKDILPRKDQRVFLRIWMKRALSFIDKKKDY